MYHLRRSSTLILFFLGTLLTSGLAAEPAKVIVHAPFADIQIGPNAAYPTFYSAEQNEILKILYRRPGWYRVRTHHGKLGWVSEDAFEKSLELKGKSTSIDTQWAHIGFRAGVIKIRGFPSELASGIDVYFDLNETFFVQYQYLHSEISQSALEEKARAGTDKDFNQHQLLLGYPLLHTALIRTHFAHTGRLSLTGGFGNTDFGGKSYFTNILGIGYQIELAEQISWRMGYQHQRFEGKLGQASKNESYRISHFSTGLSYRF